MRHPREEVCRYDFTDETGRLRFQKVRYRYLDPVAAGRPKDFGYFNPNALPVDRWRKPEGADRLIYNLPAVLRAINRGETIHSVEGEKDADALIAQGLAATSVHQGANKVTRQQMAWLFNANRVVIWVDKDVERPEVGAHDAVMRHDLLVELGFEGEIEFVRAVGPWGGLKDAHDHLAAGHAVAAAVRCSVPKLVACARLFTPNANRRAGYGR